MDFVEEQARVIGGKKGKGRGKRGGKRKETNSESIQDDETNIKGRRDPNWFDGETTLFLDLLAEVQSRRQDPNSDGGYNDHEWSYVYNVFTKKNTQMRALTSLKLRWKNLKGDFSFFWHMANRSGCNWNEEAHIPDVLEDAWRNLQEKDPTRYKKYVKKTFPWYRQVETLYGKNIATGRSNVTSDPNKQIPRTFAEVSSSEDENGAAQQEFDNFNLPEFQEMVADGVEPIAPRIDEIYSTHEPVTTTTDLPVPEPVHADIPSVTQVHSIHVDIPSRASNLGAVPTQTRKRGNNTQGDEPRRIKPRECANRMDEFAEKFLYQQQQWTEIIAQMGHTNRVMHDQVREKLLVLALSPDVHVDMEMSLGNSWIRECFMKEDSKERLMLIVERTTRMFHSGHLSLNS